GCSERPACHWSCVTPGRRAGRYAVPDTSALQVCPVARPSCQAMTTSNPASSASDRTDAQYARLRRRAIDALTQAARLSWPAHTVTAAGTERHMPQSRMDAADLIGDVVTATAANLGGIDELLAGRTGSWEAALVRQMLEGATGGDEAVLAEYRTDPITVEVDPYLLLKDTGVLDRWEEQERSAIGAVISSTWPMAVFGGWSADQNP